MSKKFVGLSLDETVSKEIENKRGLIPRSTFVNDVLKTALNIGNKGSPQEEWMTSEVIKSLPPSFQLFIEAEAQRRAEQRFQEILRNENGTAGTPAAGVEKWKLKK